MAGAAVRPAPAAPPRPEPRGPAGDVPAPAGPAARGTSRCGRCSSSSCPASVGSPTGRLRAWGCWPRSAGSPACSAAAARTLTAPGCSCSVSLGEAVAVALGIWAEQVPWAGVAGRDADRRGGDVGLQRVRRRAGRVPVRPLLRDGHGPARRGRRPGAERAARAGRRAVRRRVLQLTGALVDRHGPERQAVAHGRRRRWPTSSTRSAGRDADELQHAAALACSRPGRCSVAEQPVASRSGRARPPEGLLRLREISRHAPARAGRRAAPRHARPGRGGSRPPARVAGPAPARTSAARASCSPCRSADRTRAGVLLTAARARLALAPGARPGGRGVAGVRGPGLRARPEPRLLGGRDERARAQPRLRPAAYGPARPRAQRRHRARRRGRRARPAASIPPGRCSSPIVAVVVYGAQLLVPRNYAAAAVLITCSALLMGGGRVDAGRRRAAARPGARHPDRRRRGARRCSRSCRARPRRPGCPTRWPQPWRRRPTPSTS